MSECDTKKCASCTENCSQRTDFHEPPHDMSEIKRVISVISGKGGVGKSIVTATLASALRKKGMRVGVLDADITGPSMPRVFGIKDKAVGSEAGIFPLDSRDGVKIMSVNLLLEDDEAPVIWRGPVIAGMVKQFWTDVIWGDLDVLFIDMPPGTGDVPLTVFQTIPLDGAIIVTSPQDLVSMIVKKSFHMAEKMHIPILGLVENMSYLTCPDCKKVIYPFGESEARKVAAEMGIELLAQLPILPESAKLCDAGRVEDVNTDYLEETIEKIIKKCGL